MKKFRNAATAIGVLTLATLVRLEAVAIVNGGFESGFSGWSNVNSIGSDGSFSLQSGTVSPALGMTVPAPPGGASAAMSDGGAPGSHVLYQDFTVPTTLRPLVLKFDLFLGNRDPGTYFAPSSGSLDFAILGVNQQARIDIITTGADPFSVASEDVLLNLFQTQPGDSAVSGYTTMATDLTSFFGGRAGQILRLRFAEVDNNSPFQMGIDNVEMVLPDSGATGVLLAGSAALLVLRRRPSG